MPEDEILDPHMVQLDGSKQYFNGAGLFTAMHTGPMSLTQRLSCVRSASETTNAPPGSASTIFHRVKAIIQH